MRCLLTRCFSALALVLLLVVSVGCQLAARPKPGATPPDAVLKASEGRFADGKFTKFSTHPGNRLYDYMDGAAEAYFARGFITLATVDVNWKETQAKVELYLVRSADDAAKLFDDFNDGKGRKLAAGLRSAAWDAKELEGIFHRGPYFARVITYGNDAEARSLLDTLATAIDQSVPK
jgi:hypothetical protein